MQKNQSKHPWLRSGKPKDKYQLKKWRSDLKKARLARKGVDKNS